MLALGWLLFLALYTIGFVYYVVLDRSAWKRQNVAWSPRNLNRKHFLWPLAMLSDTAEKLRG